MLFRSMQTYLPHLNGKVFPKTNMYINSLNVRKNLIYKRFLYSNSFESGAIKLIKKILLDMDVENMVLKRKTDVSRYFDVMLNDKDQLESIFDMNETNTIRINSFVSSDKGRCNEYIIPIESTDPLQTLPFEQGWDMWKHIRPVRIMDIKSNELTFNTYLDKIIFKEQCPSHIVIGIDVVALGLQFVNYLKTFNLQKTDDNVSNYIHRYVLCFMLDDLMNNWLINQYQSLLRDAYFNDNYDYTKEVAKDQFFGFRGSEYNLFIEEMVTNIKLVKEKSLRSDMFLNSLRLGDRDFVSYIKHILKYCYIKNLRQYNWMEFLRDYRYLEIIMYTYFLQRDTVHSQNLMKAMNRDIPILIGNKFWSNCKIENTRKLIEHELTFNIFTLMKDQDV